MILDSFIWFWFIISIFNLVRMTYQDYKHNMLIDDRINYFMLGVTVSLLVVLHTNIWLILAAIGTYTINLILFKTIYKDKIGEADVSTLQWLSIGYVVIGIVPAFVFSVFLVLSLIAYGLTKKYVLKTDKPTPFMAVFLICQLGTYILLQLS